MDGKPIWIRFGKEPQSLDMMFVETSKGTKHDWHWNSDTRFRNDIIAGVYERIRLRLNMLGVKGIDVMEYMLSLYPTEEDRDKLLEVYYRAITERIVGR